ncbi:Aste57867_6634 [Aphanomyces stellatus]|uniref:Aste57867_6634 protein n=1 Tax=Aphanomyces stellatus TaxID=120398 RepID=A0A485KHB5_9STRA|nr:hypothetical protein As57867_006614 [Aphanomyces stellatus]VFT83609.1 Aste57867_6634 [Aphanomyces stellatus]
MHYELYVDEGTRYKWLFLLTSKSESLTNLKKFHVSVERQHDYKLKTIMTDNAKEYMSKELNAYCSGIGIEQLYTNPYSPEENCVVEKSNYTVEALRYVVYTENRVDRLLPQHLAARCITNCTWMKAPLQVAVSAHDYKLKTIMTDNAKEYMSKELNAYCSGIGIEQLYTNPYSPEENCVVEKSNQGARRQDSI